MLRYLDTFTRYIWLWIGPMIILPVVFTGILLSSTTYTATASLWVVQPLFGDTQTAQGFSYESPAKQMSNLLTELLSTREFVNGVIDNTSRRNLIKSEADRITSIEYIASKTVVNGDKFRLISLSFTDKNQGLAVETLDAIIARFRSYYDDQIKVQSEAAQLYYQKQVDAAKVDVDKATADVKGFLEAHPNQVVQNNLNRAVSPDDLEYTRLQGILDAANKRSSDAINNLTRAQNTYTAFQQGQTTSLQVQDKSAVSDNGSGKLRSVATGIGIGLALALFIAGILTILLTLLDNTIRHGFYARQLMKRELIIEMPVYRPVQSKKKQDKTDLVDQMDFEEGSVRPFRLFKPGSNDKKKEAIEIRHSMAGKLKANFGKFLSSKV